MIIDIPTKSDFYSMADHMVNEAWEKIADLAHEYRDIDFWNRFYSESEHFTDEDVSNIENYWTFSRPKLITAFTLILQSVEFRIKGLICEISPFLLIVNATRNPPKPDHDGNISFSEFHTLDAQDLIKVHDTFSPVKFSVKFTDWFRNMRILRNRFMHTVDMKTDISPELIFTSVVFAHLNLNPDSAHWIWHRYQYKAAHSSGGIRFHQDDEDEFSGTVWEMLQTHFEFTAAISACSKESARDYFGFTKNSPEDNNKKESFYCKKCVSVMKKSRNFDGKFIESTLETVQYNRKRNRFVCLFCHDEQISKPRGIWDEDEE